MLLQALWHMHQQDRGHCDIKRANVMVHFDDDLNAFKVTLLDLGFSCKYRGMLSAQAAFLQ